MSDPEPIQRGHRVELALPAALPMWLLAGETASMLAHWTGEKGRSKVKPASGW
jgi:hypothetical protein